MRLKNARETTRTLVVEMPDNNEKVTLVYRAGMYTGAYLDGLSEKTGPEMLAELVVSWDILDEVPDTSDTAKLGALVEVPYPITKETIELLPLRIIYTLTLAIHEDTRPNPRKQTDLESTW